ncbi:hypothetical protein AHAS_Ahas13G0101500 [Arachis hypogaea]
MQHGRIPKAICHQIEQAQRTFVWGSDEQHKRAHLINWRTLCLPKEIGGLGFKSLERMNTAFLLKVCWELINHSNALWVRALNSKYGISNSTPSVRETFGCSALWKSLSQLWPIIQESLVHRVGNGCLTKFWKDDWLNIRDHLLKHKLPSATSGDKNNYVCDFVNNEGEWKIEHLKQLLPDECIQRICANPPPRASDPPDKLAWKHSKDERFSVKSAYCYSNRIQSQGREVWKRIWTWKGPQRMKLFIWQATHDRILTNKKRSQWYGSSPMCHHCGNTIEDTLHVLRDCDVKPVWKKFVK